MKTDGLFDYSLVADNDAQESGRSTVENTKEEAKFHINYDVEPERSMSLARNRTLKNVTGDLIAFINDDESPVDDWLINH